MKKLQSWNDQVITPSDEVDMRVLAAGVAERHTVRTGANFVHVNSSSDFYIRWHASLDASVPGADVTDGSGAEFKPGLKNVVGLASFSIVSPVVAVVSLAFYGPVS